MVPAIAFFNLKQTIYLVHAEDEDRIALLLKFLVEQVKNDG